MKKFVVFKVEKLGKTHTCVFEQAIYISDTLKVASEVAKNRTTVARNNTTKNDIIGYHVVKIECPYRFTIYKLNNSYPEIRYTAKSNYYDSTSGKYLRALTKNDNGYPLYYFA